MPKSQYKSAKPAYQAGVSGSQPPADSVAVFEWEQFERLDSFSDKNLLPVLQRISSDIIERPYHYDRHVVYNAEGKQMDYSHVIPANDAPPAKIKDGAVYKQNHGTGHALRQMVYTDKLLGMIAS